MSMVIDSYFLKLFYMPTCPATVWYRCICKFHEI